MAELVLEPAVETTRERALRDTVLWLSRARLLRSRMANAATGRRRRRVGETGARLGRRSGCTEFVVKGGGRATEPRAQLGKSQGVAKLGRS